MIHAMALGSVYASVNCITFAFCTRKQHCLVRSSYLQLNLLNGFRCSLRKHILCHIHIFHWEFTLYHTVVFSSTEFGKWERYWNDSCHGSKLSLRKRLLCHICISHFESMLSNRAPFSWLNLINRGPNLLRSFISWL